MWCIVMLAIVLALQSSIIAEGFTPEQLQEIRGLVQTEVSIEVTRVRDEKDKENALLTAKFGSMEIELAALKVEKKRFTNYTTSGRRDAGRPPTDCPLGSNFLFDEYPEFYGAGLSYGLPAAGNAYRCLDLCVQDPDCVAVSVGHAIPWQCDAYSDRPIGLQPTPLWDYYEMIHTNSCVVNRPTIEFMMTLTSDQSYSADELVVWDYEVYDSGDGISGDGKFYCPVSGTYQFTINANSYNYVSAFTLRKNDVTIIGRLYFDQYEAAEKVPGTIDVYTYCGSGDTVSVWGDVNGSDVLGGSSYLYTTFSGRLV